MNIQQGPAVDNANLMYSIDKILKPRLEMQRKEEAAPASVSLEATAPSPAPATDPLPTLGRYINVWA